MPVSHTVRIVTGPVLMAGGVIRGVLASFDASVISGAITAIGLAVGGVIVFVSGARTKAKAAELEAARKERTADREADRDLKRQEQADLVAQRNAEIELARAEANARLEREAAEAAARLKIEADAQAVRLAMEAEAERARTARELEREAKLGPSLTRKIETLNAELEALRPQLEEARRELINLRAGQQSIEKKIDQTTKFRVVIVDDDESTRQATCKLLSNHDYDCTSVGTLRDARALMSSKVDWFLIDVKLDGESGLDLLREIKGRRDRCWVGVLTGADHRALSNAERGFADFTAAKPLDPEKLLSKMRSCEDMAPRPTVDDVAEALTGSKSDFQSVKIEEMRP